MEPITVKWVSPAQKTVLASFNSEWDLHDLTVAVTAIHRLVSSVQHDVSIIIWHRVQPNSRLFGKLSSIHKSQPNNARLVLIVPYTWSTGIMLMTTWMTVIERLYPAKSKQNMVRTLDDALTAAGESVTAAALEAK